MDQQPKSHKLMSVQLNEKAFKFLKPLFERLSEPELLERCSRGATQNANESLHAQIWRKCPKEVFVSKSRIHVVNAIMEKNCVILKSKQIKNSNSRKTLSDISQEIYERMDRTRLIGKLLKISNDT